MTFPLYIFIIYVLCLVVQSCLTLCDPMDCSPPGSSVHGDSPGKNTRVGCHCFLQGIFLTQESNLGLLDCRWILYVWVTREAHKMGGIQNCTWTNRTSRMDKILLSFGKCPSVRKSFKRILTFICLSFDFRQLDKKGYKKQFPHRGILLLLAHS